MTALEVFLHHLERRRESAGLSRRELIQRSGVSASFYYEILRGEGSPTLTVLEHLASAVNAHVCDLLQPLHGASQETLNATLPPGYELVTVALPPERAFQVRRWGAEALSKAHQR